MANVGNAFKQLGQSFGKLNNVLSKTFDKAARTDAAEEAIKFTKEATKNPDRGIFGTAIGWGTWGVRKPMELAVRGTSKIVDGVATAYGYAPILTTAVAGGLAATGTVGAVNAAANRREAAEREMMAEQQMMALQMQSYKNVTSPSDYERMEAMSRAGGNVSQADAEMQRRAAAAAAQAPTT